MHQRKKQPAPFACKSFFAHWLVLSTFLTCATLTCHAQYKADHIPGFIGLQSGTQPPPGLYIASDLWVYPTDTVKDDNGNAYPLVGSLTSTANITFLSAVTNKEVLRGNFGAAVALPFIKNRIDAESLHLESSFAFSDMFTNLALGWKLKHADITAGYNQYFRPAHTHPAPTTIPASECSGCAASSALQDAIKVNQKSPGTFEVPKWDPASQKKVRDALVVLSSTLPDMKHAFGPKGQVDPARYLIGSAAAWGGNPDKDAIYLNVTPTKNDGTLSTGSLFPAACEWTDSGPSASTTPRVTMRRTPTTPTR